MTGLDWIILGLVLLLALFGWVQGFVAGALALAGFALGAWLGTRLGPLVLSDGSAYSPAFGLLGALVAGAAFAAGFEGLGARLRKRLRLPGLAFVDGLLGALLTACVGLGVVWVLAAVAVQSAAGDLRQQVQRSEILSRLNAALPPSGPLLNQLGRFDPFPRIDGPEARVAPPRAGIARDAEVRGAAASVVKVLGTACGLGVEGSGWVARPGLVVTNAHVVAGQHDTRVLPGGHEPGLTARAVAFDSRNDLAVLRVEGLGAAPLPLADEPRPAPRPPSSASPTTAPSTCGPGGWGRRARRSPRTPTAAGPVQRRLTSLRGVVRSGNSGGPMVDGRGRVVATIFAATTSGPRGGYGVPNAVVARTLDGVRGPVSTGPCAG